MLISSQAIDDSFRLPSGKRPIPADEFPAAIAELCQRLGIEIEDNEDGVFLLRVKLNKSAPKLRLST